MAEAVRNLVRVKRSRAVEVLLTSPSLGAAAARLQVSERTVRRWLTRPEVLGELRAAQAALTSHTAAFVEEVYGAAVSVLVDIMADRTVPAIARVAAVRTLAEMRRQNLDYQSVLVRVEALEADLEQRGRNYAEPWELVGAHLEVGEGAQAAADDREAVDGLQPGADDARGSRPTAIAPLGPDTSLGKPNGQSFLEDSPASNGRGLAAGDQGTHAGGGCDEGPDLLAELEAAEAEAAELDALARAIRGDCARCQLPLCEGECNDEPGFAPEGADELGRFSH